MKMRSFSCFKPRDPFKNWSKELDKRVAIWARNFDSSFKLLLLGPAGAGKTTIMKQMKIIHFEGFSLEERQQKAKEIRSNLLESVRELTACITASGYEIDWCDKENKHRLDFINGLNLDDQTYDIYAAKIYDYSKRILTDKGVEDLFAKLNQLSITHRSQYLLNRVDEIRNVNYIPNNDDILQSRRKTSDIQKLEFHVKLPVKSGPSIKQTFCMFDVGGQRGERRKWIQVFDGVSAVMFLIDSSSFDAIDDENGRNKLKETINLFYEVWTTRFLCNSNFVLLFNKQDILREKIERGLKIEDHFPEYKLYKFQPSERHLSHDARTSEKLNLFRTSSSRSTRSSSSGGGGGGVKPAATSSSAAPLSTQSTNSLETNRASGCNQMSSPEMMKRAHKLTTSTSPKCDKDTYTSSPPPAAAASTTKRKSASLYLFKTSSSKQNKSQVPLESQRQSSCPGQVDAQMPTTTNLDNLSGVSDDDNDSTIAATPSTPRITSARRSTRAASGGNGNGNGDQVHDQATANHLAYIKARSFIRDKFIQITRQVDQPLDQRKYSSPNLPAYNTAAKMTSGAPGGGHGTTQSTRQPDRPRRNVCYHYTTATDTENIRDLFENLQKMVLKSTMKDLIQ